MSVGYQCQMLEARNMRILCGPWAQDRIAGVGGITCVSITPISVCTLGSNIGAKQSDFKLVSKREKWSAYFKISATSPFTCQALFQPLTLCRFCEGFLHLNVPGECVAEYPSSEEEFIIHWSVSILAPVIIVILSVLISLPIIIKKAKTEKFTKFKQDTVILRGWLAQSYSTICYFFSNSTPWRLNKQYLFVPTSNNIFSVCCFLLILFCR